MPRIDTASQAHDKEIEKKLEQIESRVKRSNRHVFSCFNCLIYFLLILLVSGFFLAKAVAKTGVVHVPYFTSSYFTTPKPDHTVTTSKDTAQITLYDKIKAQVITAQIRGESSSSIPVLITEADMSKALFTYLNRNSQKYDQAQVAVVGQSLEVFLHTKDSSRYVTAVIVPALDDAGLKIEVESLKVGLLPMPTSLINWAVKVFFADGVGKVNNWLNEYTHVNSMTWKPGAIELNIQVLNNGTFFDGL